MDAGGFIPQCVVCGQTFQNSTLFPAKMIRHLQSKHAQYKDKPVDFFTRKRDELIKNQKCMQKVAMGTNEKATEASYRVSLKIAEMGAAHTIAENLIKPCALELARCILNDKAAAEISLVPLSNNTVSRRIHDMADDVKNQLISYLRKCWFALQMDESTDVAGLAILLVFVRYQFDEDIREDLLLCEALESNTNGEQIFLAVDTFFTNHTLSWENCIDVCTDGAKSMVGIIAGAVTRIKRVAKNCSSSHCILHRHALATKKMPETLKCVLDDAVKIINYIKSRPLQSRLFKILCADMGSEHSCLLLHTEVRWLSRGKILVRLFELRDEVRAFLMDSASQWRDQMSDEIWLYHLAYLSDIFTKLNDDNRALQGKRTNKFSVHDKIRALKRKLDYWITAIKSGNLDSFPTLKEFSECSETCSLPVAVTNVIIDHLQALRIAVTHYFPEEWHETVLKSQWVNNPFLVSEKPDALSSLEYEKLLEMMSDSTLRESFKQQSLAEFWCGVQNEYPELYRKALVVLLPFVSTYSCETGFSAYVAVKTKYRNCLDAGPDLRLKLSSLKPNIGALCAGKTQYQPSH